MIKLEDKNAKVNHESDKGKTIKTKDSHAPKVFEASTRVPKRIVRQTKESIKAEVKQSTHDITSSGQESVYDNSSQQADNTTESIGKGVNNVRRKATDKATQKMRNARREKVLKDLKKKNAQKGSKTADNIRKAPKKAKQAGKRTVKTAQKTQKTAQQAAKHTKKATKTAIKTTKQAAKAAQKAAKAAAQLAKKAAQAAKAAAKAAVKAAQAAVKAIAALVKAVVAAIKGIIAAIAAGGWVAVVVIIIIAVVLLILGSAFGIFFADDEANSVTVSEAMTTINDGFNSNIVMQISELRSKKEYDNVEVVYLGDGGGDSTNNWADVLTVYACYYMEANEEVMSINEEKLAQLDTIFNQMNKATVTGTETEVEETVVDDDGNETTEKKTMLHITVDIQSATYDDGIITFSLERHLQTADEMMSPAYYTLWADLMGVDVYDGNNATDIISNLPKGTKGAEIVEYAMQRLGDPYSQAKRGQKNYTDCSHMAWWAYNQAGVEIPNVSASQAKYCSENGYLIGKEELQPGDLIFWQKPSCKCGRWNEVHHTAIYIGDGKIIEASSGKGRVVISNMYDTTKWKLHSFARPHIK